MGQGSKSSSSASLRKPETPFSLAGYGFCLAWTWMLLYTARISPLIGEDELIPHAYRLVGLAVMTLVLGGVILFHRRRLSGTESDKRLSAFVSIFGVLATLFVAIAGTAPWPVSLVVAICGWVAMGVTFAFLTYAWVKLYSSVEASSLCLYLCCSMTLGAICVYVLCYLPIIVTTIVTAALPAFSSYSFLQAQGHVGYEEHIESEHHISDTHKKFPSSLLRLLIATFVYTLVYAALINPLSTRRGYGFEANGGIMLAAPLVVGMLVFALVWFKKSEDLSNVYRCVLPTMVIAFVIFPFVSGWTIYAAGFLGSAAFQCFSIVVWTLLNDSAQHYGYSSLGALLFGQLVYSIGMFAGSAVGSVLALHDLFHQSSLFTMLCMVAVVVLVIVTTLMLRESELFGKNESSANNVGSSSMSAMGFASSVEDRMNSMPSAEEIFNDKVAHVTARFNLTPREKEVFAMLARGRSNKYIEEKLVISEHTVDSHVTHIYRKCNVHSRQEIIDMVDHERPSDDNPYPPVGSANSGGNADRIIMSAVP